MKILIVDDCPQIRELLREVCEMQGHIPIEAGTLRDAVALLESQPVSVALIDGNFPLDRSADRTEAYGPWLCRKARSLGIRTLLLTADDDLVDEERAAGYQAARKPFTLPAIFEALNESARIAA